MREKTKVSSACSKGLEPKSGMIGRQYFSRQRDNPKRCWVSSIDRLETTSSMKASAASVCMSLRKDFHPGRTVNKATEGAVIADASMSGNQLPMEVWRQVALCMSTREMAKGLVQTCKALRHLSTSAICLSSGSGMCYRSGHVYLQRYYTHDCRQNEMYTTYHFV